MEQSVETLQLLHADGTKQEIAVGFAADEAKALLQTEYIGGSCE